MPVTGQSLGCSWEAQQRGSDFLSSLCSLLRLRTAAEGDTLSRKPVTPVTPVPETRQTRMGLTQTWEQPSVTVPAATPAGGPSEADDDPAKAEPGTAPIHLHRQPLQPPGNEAARPATPQAAASG